MPLLRLKDDLGRVSNYLYPLPSRWDHKYVWSGIVQASITPLESGIQNMKIIPLLKCGQTPCLERRICNLYSHTTFFFQDPENASCASLVAFSLSYAAC